MIKLTGIITILTVIGFIFASCNDDGNNPGPTVLTGTVTIGGTAEVGQSLIANTDLLDGSGTISYQWRREETVDIGTGSFYTVLSADIGYTITVTVTRLGYSGSVTSPRTTAVIDTQPQATPGLAFSLIDGNTAYAVSRGTANAAHVLIPEIHEGLPVTAIANNGFSTYVNLESIIISNRVTRIGNFAFSGCTNLISVTIPSSVTNIGSSVFAGCTRLTSITIPFVGEVLNGTTNTHFGYLFGASTVAGQNSFIPASLRTVIITGGNIIDNNAFQNCAGLTSITIPNSVINIGANAFQDCSNLTSVTFRGTITSSNFPTTSFPGDLVSRYFANDGGIGTYTRQNGTTNTWTGAPTGITAIAASSSSITVSWSSIPGATEYRILRSLSDTGTFTLVGTSEISSFTDTVLAEGTTYFYRVVASYTNGTSPQSVAVNRTTLPGIPSGVTATAVSSTSITVSWNSTPGATGYRIFRSTSDTGTFTEVGTSTTTTFTNTGLTAGMTYYYRVTASNTGGTGLQSTTVNVTLLDTPSEVTAATVTLGNIIVNWSPVTGATGYRIFRSLSATGIFTETGTSTTNSFHDDTLLHTGLHHSYFYRVAAYNNSGISSQSNTAAAPGTPAGVYATAISSSGINVNWNHMSGVTWSQDGNPVEPGTTGFKIYRSSSASGIFTEVGTSTTTSFTDTELTANTTYYYRVASTIDNVIGLQSTTVDATTLAVDSPTGVDLTEITTNSITITWVSISDATGYRIFRSTLDTDQTEIGTSTITSFIDTGLTEGTTYFYSVAAYNNHGTGAQSNVVSAPTIPGIPTGVTLTSSVRFYNNPVNLDIQITWDTVPGASGYRVFRSTSDTGVFTMIGSVLEHQTWFPDSTGLSESSTLYYRVSAFNISGDGLLSDISSITLPGTPTALRIADMTSSSVTIAWNPVPDATGYIIYRSLGGPGGGGPGPDSNFIEVGTSTTATFTDTEFTGTTFFYRVAAYNDSGRGSLSFPALRVPQP
ncbi:MAG: fibronectin type III domain-containing protein [Treponema sp.]|jgi:fibronectin type 3 domain-containing protein|nr:fibronectin type III domain-containing protein [Treponema sp.]